MKKEISIESFLDYPKLLDYYHGDSYSSESTLYFKNKRVIKIFKESLRLEREAQTLMLAKLKLKNVAPIIDVLYDPNIGFYGYTMPLIKGRTIKESLTKYDFSQKLKLMALLDEILLELKNKDLIYIDWHTSNVLIRNNAPILIDQVSMIKISHCLESMIPWVLTFFMNTILSVLFEYDIKSGFDSTKALPLLQSAGIGDTLHSLERENFRKFLYQLECLGEEYISNIKEESLSLILKKE